jgi:predicted enzyme related to lactoylglutathione lyase
MHKEFIMNQGAKEIIYPVTDIAQAKAQFSKLLGVEPFVDSPYYVGFMVGGQQIGLDPNGHRHGATAYYQVDDLRASLNALLEAGAETIQDVRDVGHGKLVASVKDASGNIIGLFQMP